MSDRVIDWVAIRARYENGEINLSSLEREFGVSRQSIKKHAEKEEWVTPVTEQLPVTVTGNHQGVITRDVDAALKVAKAIEYRQAGWTYERIAIACGYANHGSARNAIQRELDRVVTQHIEEWRSDHVSRLERMHEEVWPMAVLPKEKANDVLLAANRLPAIDRLLDIMEREAKLLGLDKKPDEALGPQIIIEEVPANYFEGPPQ